MAGGCAVLFQDWEGTWSEQKEPSRKKGKTVVDGSERFSPHESGVGGTVKIQVSEVGASQTGTDLPSCLWFEDRCSFLSQNSCC